MAQQRSPRVLIAGQQDNFNQILAANLRRQEFEVSVSPSVLDVDDMDRYDMNGDILLYDLDEPFRRAGKQQGSNRPQRDLLTSDILRSWERLSAGVSFTLALSSGSVTRSMLTRMGAVGLLYKPFGMERLQPYLHVFRRLLLAGEEAAQETGKGNRLPAAALEEDEIRVLVVDDNATMARLVSQQLQAESGFHVDVAYDGLQALERCLDWRPHCVVTDLIMPWMNGYQVMHCLSVATRNMPGFVVLSALTQLEKPVAQPFLGGATVVYVDKPFRMDHLLTKIKQVCARP